MKRMVDRPEQAFAVEEPTAKDQRLILLEQGGDSGEDPDDLGIGLARRWCSMI